MSVDRPRILVVDDDEVKRNSLDRLLREQGYEVDLAVDGPEAAQKVRSLPDLVLLDIKRPDASGFDLCQVVKSNPETAAIPVIQLSTSAGASDRIQGLQSGADAYLTHPIDEAELLATVHCWLRARREAVRLVEAERLAREQAEEADHLKDEFLAMLSHDLRTPLTAILGWAEFLKTNEAAPGQVAEGIEVISRNAKAQARLLEDLLDVSRIISGKLQLFRAVVGLPPIVESALESLQLELRARRVSVKTSIQPQLGSVYGDASRLQQVVWNLLSNAIKFTPPGGQIEVRIQQSGGSVDLKVVDNGVGIDGSFLPFVFDRFRQGPNSLKGRKGLGLGLAIVRHLVELHGGAVFAESAGRHLGSTFTVRLPAVSGLVAETAGPDLVREGATDAHDAFNLRGITLLVVDDEPDTLHLLRRILDRRGATVLTAASADEGIQLFESALPDILLSDIGMPGENGLAFIRRVRHTERDVEHQTPAIAITAYARQEDRLEAMAAGFNAYVAKPVVPKELVNIIAGLCHRAPAAQCRGSVPKHDGQPDAG